MDPFAVACVLIMGALLSSALMRHPRLVMALWLAVMIAVPVWIEVRLGAVFPPLSILFLVMIPAILKAADARVAKTDALILVFTAMAAVSTFFAGTPMFAFTTIVVQWLPAYFVGRHLAPAAGKDWTYQAIAIAAGVVGTWALIEFAFGLHIFEDFAGTSQAAGWQTIQERGPYTRSEGAFGHAIAMGAFLSIGIPFVLAANIKPLWRALLLTVTLGGLMVTFSRGPLLGGLLVVILAVLASPALSRRVRGWMVVLLVASGFTLLPMVLGLFDSLSYDTDASTGYRELLFQTIFEDMNALGPAQGFSQASDGRYVYWTFGSIDNQYVLSVIQSGWLPVAFLLIGLGAVAWRVIVQRAGGPADIALVGQIWVMATVALITQYGMAVWFIVGMAVAFGSRKSSAVLGKDGIPQEICTAETSRRALDFGTAATERGK